MQCGEPHEAGFECHHWVPTPSMYTMILVIAEEWCPTKASYPWRSIRMNMSSTAASEHVTQSEIAVTRLSLIRDKADLQHACPSTIYTSSWRISHQVLGSLRSLNILLQFNQFLVRLAMAQDKSVLEQVCNVLSHIKPWRNVCHIQTSEAQ